MDSSFPPHEQIQEQRRALAEETVSYAIYLPPSAVTADPHAIAEDQEQPEFHVSLESVQLAKTLIGALVADLAKDYMWHRDAFSIRIESGNGQFPSGQPYLKGDTRVGDSLDDEWLNVFLLREITKRIPGSVARIQDNDGEFLLIEAADYIPSWLDPDNSENRVFIYGGNLHIIPIAITAEEKKTFPSTVGTRAKSPKLQDALDMIRSSQSPNKGQNSGLTAITTMADLKIQQAAFGPLLPDSDDEHFAARKIREQRHYARCQIPIDVARILKIRPELITRACEAFYTRDALGMAACSRMTQFLPITSSAAGPSASTTTPTMATSKSSAAAEPSQAYRLGKNSTPFLTTSVCFTKMCYAQLMGQQFHPPKIWDEIVPPPRAQDANDPQKVKEAELGMKLTCGFEILCSPDYPGDFGFRSGDEIALEGFPFATDNSWRVFKSNLTARKYFGDERPGSSRYQQAEETAKRQFLEHKSTQLRDSDDPDESSVLGSASFHGHGYHPVQEIKRILSNTSDTIERKDVNDVTTLVDDRKDDDDSWMDVDLQMLEDMMRTRGFGGASKDVNRSSKAGLDMQQMLDRFGEFIQEGEGGIEGAEFLDEQSDSEEEQDDDTESEEEEDEQSRPATKENESMDATEHDEDEDMFASDYEEQQAKKQAAKKGGAFMFGTDAMTFENGVEDGPSKAKAKNSQAFAADRNKFKDILTKTFGEHLTSVRVKGYKEGADSGGEDEEVDGQGLQEYMAALDAELSATKIGESFEKKPAESAASKTSQSALNSRQPKEEKGKGVARPSKALKPEKNLEELMKEYTERSRRGFSRHGPLPGAGDPYGYDPAAMAFADDDDDEDDSEVPSARVGFLSPDDEIGDEMSDEEEEEVVDVDLNLAKNLLESFKSQGGLPGPGGNILSRLGIILPRDEEDEDEE